ncbi:MAG: sugar phosphate nucleotidyltransferase [Acutalibacteraceae bacterium]
MITVIMAGGKGTRILEETQFIPKAMVRIGDKPIIEHIMDSYAQQGFHDFLILTGYKGEILSDYFKKKPEVLLCEENGNFLNVKLPDRSIQLLYTGEETESAARLRLAKPYITGESFMLTYCDGLCSVNYENLVRFHNEHKKTVTLTAVRPEPRFGILEIDQNGIVKSFKEKDRNDSPVINGGFMVMDLRIFDFLTETMEQLEKDVLLPLSKIGELTAYYHDGFWQCMDTLQEKKYLCSLWERNEAAWINKKKDKV